MLWLHLRRGFQSAIEELPAPAQVSWRIPKVDAGVLLKCSDGQTIVDACKHGGTC